VSNPAPSANGANTAGGGTGSELSTHEAQPAFEVKVQRNLVLVRAVVRDASGRPVGDLKKEDFRIFDAGKPQVISQFSAEGPAALPAVQPKTQAAAVSGEFEEDAAKTTVPLRYLAFLFDDVQADFEGLVRSRDAAGKYLAQAMRPGDRVGVFTVSGRGNLDFTSDQARIHEALAKLSPRPIRAELINPCPDINAYQAYMIVQRQDATALQAAALEVFHCRYNEDPRSQDASVVDARTEAQRIFQEDQNQAEYDFRGVEQVVRRMGTLPGQRDLVFVSPGFLTEMKKYEVSQVIDAALRNRVIINTLDSRGLYTPTMLGDVNQRVTATPERPDLMGARQMYRIDHDHYCEDVLAEFAANTGGVFFHNSNDYDEGFRRTGALVSFYYTLGYSPEGFKYDGRFHPIKVKLARAEKYDIQARRGYFAPRHAVDPAQQEKQDIEEAVFSQEEMGGLPVDIHTQFFKADTAKTQLAVVADLQLAQVHFRKDQGRNCNDLTFVAALFDQDGNYLMAKEKKVEFRLRDTTLERLSHAPIKVKMSFEVFPGTYLVREVVRESGDGLISGLNRTIEIPY
jgi:VWFA-related protein